MNHPHPTASPDVTWILDGLVEAPHARHAVLASADGLPVAGSKMVGREMAETVSAITSAMQALSHRGADFVAPQTPWQQTMVQYQDGFLFIIAAGQGAFLVASAGIEVDVHTFAGQMAKVVDRLGDELAVAPRPSAKPT